MNSFLRKTVRICAIALAICHAKVSLPDESIDAATIYQESCSVCHGDDGSGAIWGRASLATAPRDFTSSAAQRELTRDRMVASITYGRPGTPMPGFSTQLEMPEIIAVADFIRQTFMQGVTQPDTDTAIRRSTAEPGESTPLAYPNGLVGDINRGRDYYLENCVACHGAAGGGDGPRAYFIFPKPRNFTDPATRDYFGRNALYRGISDGVIGKEMPAWSKVMSDQQIADVAEFVYRQFIDRPASARDAH